MATHAGLISDSADPRRLGRSAYPYFHIPMIAEIIVAAAADEVSIAHPTDPATVGTAALILGGPVLFLVGKGLFKWSLCSMSPGRGSSPSGRWPPSSRWR